MAMHINHCMQSADRLLATHADAKAERRKEICPADADAASVLDFLQQLPRPETQQQLTINGCITTHVMTSIISSLPGHRVKFIMMVRNYAGMSSCTADRLPC